MSELTAREQAEKNFQGKNKGRGPAGMVAYRFRGVGWAILDHADAVRELAAAVRARPTIVRKYRR